MDTSLRSLKNAFRNAALASKYGDKSGVYAFVLITPSDANTFQELISAYDEMHWLTGKHIRILGPTIVVDNFHVSREAVALALRNRFDQSRVDAFVSAQTRESYEFATFIGLPASKLPAVVFFDTLIRPTEFSVWRVAGGGLVEKMRSLASHLSEKCKWRDLDILQQMKSGKNGEIRNLQSKLDGKAASIENRKRRLLEEPDTPRKYIILDHVRMAEHRIEVLKGHMSLARERFAKLVEETRERVKSALTVHDALQQWAGGKVVRYRINARNEIWDSAISSAEDWSEDFKWRGTWTRQKWQGPQHRCNNFSLRGFTWETTIQQDRQEQWVPTLRRAI
jgi:hypothetical protein